MTIRALFTVTGITRNHWNPDSATIRFDCQYDQQIPEDQRFYDATPTGHVEMLVNNPRAIEEFALGKKFYADFVPVE